MTDILLLTIAVLSGLFAASVAVILAFVLSPDQRDEIDDETKRSVVLLAGCMVVGMLAGLGSLGVAS